MQVCMIKEPIGSRTIRYRGIFDMDGLYKMMVQWIKSRDFDFYDRRNLDKPPYKIFKLEGRKKINYTVMYTLNPEIWVMEGKPVEIIKDGHMKHLMEGRLKIIIDGNIILDYDGDFEDTPGNKKIEKFLYGKVLYHEYFIKHLDYFDYYLYDMMQDVKKFLEMETATNAY